MEEKQFTPLSTEYDQSHTIFPEEFAEGPYGSPMNFDMSRDFWRDDMYPAPRFTYEARGFHEGTPRQDPGAHKTHDEQGTNVEGPFGPGVGEAGSE
ncbi:hypothetical protein [Ammoniphilus resinae]|uniref:Uncharacterized protein n=1 Tax=Ammoniphilus resinae TaxID=861532 RepID=A0ABS4GL21_9BACL|nr:hypothetical protein [Ammoniphilus resinae]MBP1930960.1 hypothetical protein [Ammoniphilus resinae]